MCRRTWIITNVELRQVRDIEAYSAFSASAGRQILGPRGLPLVKPPYGSITAIDLNSGEHLWRTAVGKGPVNHPALKGLDLPDMGWDNRTFVLATPNLLLATSQDPHDLADAGRDYFVDRDAYLRAYDLASGAGIGRVELPSNAYGAPMSYTAGGRQYVVVPLGNRERPPELVALAIPHEDEELPPQGRDRADADHKAFLRGGRSYRRRRQRDATETTREVPRASDGARLFRRVLRIPALSRGHPIAPPSRRAATSATAPKRG